MKLATRFSLKSQQQPNLTNHYTTKLLLCVLLTIIAVYSYRYFPEKKLTLHPAANTNFWLYSDNNKKDRASWVSQAAASWLCEIDNDGDLHHVCGFGTSLGKGIGSTGLDLSDYNRIKFELQYQGPDKHVRLYIRNYLPGFSDIDNIDKHSMVNVLLSADELNKPMTIELSKFVVAEWWISQYEPPFEFMYPKFENSVVFGIDMHYPSTPGKHDYQLKNLEFLGLWITAENWYLSILIFWMIVIASSGVYNFWQLRQQLNFEHKALEALTSSHSSLETKTKHYRQLSITDQLTGLMSRHGLSEFVDQYFISSPMIKMSLIVIDIDFFKKINDTYGHACGDLVLQRVATAIQNNASLSETVARWGGEEFVVISPETNPDTIFNLAEKIRTAVAALNIDNMPSISVTISLSIGFLKENEPFHKLFKRVDIALYRAKNNGRNRTEVASDEDTH